MEKKWMAALPGPLLPAWFGARPAKTISAGAGWFYLVCAATAIAALGWTALRPHALPPAPGVNAPGGTFSAARAFIHVRALAAAPRPLASSANARAREYIVEQLRMLGLEPRVQAATVQRTVDHGFRNMHATLAVVHNVIALLPGAAPGHGARRALLLVSHYDSASDSLGAADGAASSAAMLETLRALRTGAPPKDDIIFLFADGEKIGGYGTQAFVEQYALAGHVGAALRFDNAGNRGALALVDSSNASRAAISAWARTARPRGSSFLREVWRLTPGAVGIGALSRLDAPVLQFATLDGDDGPGDTPERLDLRSLQHEGATMLALARALSANAPAGAHAGSGEVFAALPPFGVLHYSAKLVWPLTRLACLLLFGVCCLAAQRARVETRHLVQGAFGFAVGGLALVFGPWLLWMDEPSMRREAQAIALAHGSRLLLASAALSGALFLGLHRHLQRGAGMHGPVLGALACVALALLAISWVAPGASFLLAWPLLAALCTVAALLSRRVATLGRAARAAIVLAGATPALLFAAPALREAVAVQPPGLPLALLALTGLCLLPLLALAPRFTARALLLAGLACAASAGEAHAIPETVRQPNPLVYYQHMPTWHAWWVARTPTLDRTTRTLFAGQAAPRRLIDVFGWNSDKIWYTLAPRTSVAFPYAIMLVSDDTPLRRHVEFELTSKNRAPEIELSIKGGRPLRSTVNGRVLTDGKDFSLAISLFGMEDKPLRIGIDMMGDPIVEIHVEERIPGLPRDALPPAVEAASRRFLPMTGTTVAVDDVIFR